MFFKPKEDISQLLQEQLKQYVYDIVGSMQDVYRELPSGLPEYVYQEALSMVFDEKYVDYKKEYICHPTFRGVTLKSHLRMDMVVVRERGNIIVECKAIECIGPHERQQLFSYMIGSSFPIGILVNFGSYPKMQIEKYYYDRKDNSITPF